MGVQGISSHANSSSTTQFPTSEIIDDERKRSELFHIRVIIKRTKIDTLLDCGPQVNLIFEESVKKLGLKTKPHF